MNENQKKKIEENREKSEGKVEKYQKHEEIVNYIIKLPEIAVNQGDCDGITPSFDWLLE